MFQLIETIRLENGGFSNLEYHFNRMKKAWKELYSIDNPPFDLAQMLKKYAVPSQGLFKCRIVYGKDITDIGILPYIIRPVNSLKAVYDDTITYDHKYEDRSAIEALFSKRGFCDDIVIVKDGLLTDTSSANIILKFSDKWFTPAYPLLRGTMRQSLLDQNRIIEMDISIAEIKKFTEIKLINAMLGDSAPLIEAKKIML